jgi:hypothetical protein
VQLVDDELPVPQHPGFVLGVRLVPVDVGNLATMSGVGEEHDVSWGEQLRRLTYFLDHSM